MRVTLFFLFLFTILLFTYFSYTVARERWQQIDFDTTVKLQDRIPQRFDKVFSYFSLLGSAEVTVGFCLLMMLLSFMRKHFLAIIGWLMIVPATVIEIFGKLVVFHPGPPVFFHRTLQPTNLPSFYIHTDFSYPSGHMTRTVFIIVIFAVMIIFASKNSFLYRLVVLSALASLALIMGITRVYLGEHWLSDVLGGSLLGISAGLLASILILRTQKV